jgi:hypothetical protein
MSRPTLEVAEHPNCRNGRNESGKSESIFNYEGYSSPLFICTSAKVPTMPMKPPNI